MLRTSTFASRVPVCSSPPQHTVRGKRPRGDHVADDDGDPPWVARKRVRASHQTSPTTPALVPSSPVRSALRLWFAVRAHHPIPDAAFTEDDHWTTLAHFVGLHARVTLNAAQLRALRFMANAHARAGAHADGGAIVAHAMGSGKTLASLVMSLACQRAPFSGAASPSAEHGATTRRLHYAVPIGPQRRVRACVAHVHGPSTLVLCPKSVVASWCNELRAHMPSVRFAVYGGTEREWFRVDERSSSETCAKLRRVPVGELRTHDDVRRFIDAQEVVVCHYQALSRALRRSRSRPESSDTASLSSPHAYVADASCDETSSSECASATGSQSAALACGHGPTAACASPFSATLDDGDVRSATDELRSRRWRSVIVDEAHWARNARGQLATLLRELDAHRVWALTGTPVVNGLGDVWSLLRIVRAPHLGTLDEFDTDEYAEQRAALCATHMDRLDVSIAPNASERAFPHCASSILEDAFTSPSIAAATSSHRVASSPPHHDEEREHQLRLSQWLIARRQHVHMDAVTTLAGALRTRADGQRSIALGCTLRIDMHSEEQRAYDALEQRIGSAWSAITQLRVQCARGPGTCVPRKAQVLADLLQHEFAREAPTSLPAKAVVFCHYIDACHELARHLHTLSGGALRCVVATGSGKRVADRHAVVRDFARNDSPHNVLINTWVLAEGINELSCAHVCVLYTPHWHHVRGHQAYKRCHRGTQSRNVHVYQLLYTRSVEDRVLTVADRKDTEARHLMADSRHAHDTHASSSLHRGDSSTVPCT